MPSVSSRYKKIETAGWPSLPPFSDERNLENLLIYIHNLPNLLLISILFFLQDYFCKEARPRRN